MKKRIISLLLALVLVVGVCPVAFAVEVNTIDYTAMANKAAEHLAHLSIYYPELASETSGDTQLGQQIFIYVLQDDEVVQSDYCYIPILRDGAVIALADYDLNGNTLVGMSISLVDGINAYLAESDEPFSILWDDHTPYLCTSDGSICLEQTSSEAAYSIAPAATTQNMTLNDITAVANVGNAPENMEIVVADEQSMARTTVSVTVPAKAQWGPDHCWAACVASVGQQQTGKDYDSQTVARIMGRDSGGANAQEIVDALHSIYNIDAFVCVNLYTSTVIEKLNAKKPPILLAYVLSDTTGAVLGAHAVVAYSFSGNPNSGTLGYMDPMGGRFSTISTSANGVFNFVWEGNLFRTLAADLIT